MQHALAIVLIGTSLTLFAGCSGDAGEGDGTEEHNDTGTDDHSEAGGEEGHSNEGGGDEHGDDHSHDPASAITIGMEEVDGVMVSVEQLGGAHAGDETLTFWVKVESEAGDVEAVRVVVTTPGGGESLRVRAVLLDTGVWDADVTELPAELPAGSTVEVEVALAGGGTRLARFPISLD